MARKELDIIASHKRVINSSRRKAHEQALRATACAIVAFIILSVALLCSCGASTSTSPRGLGQITVEELSTLEWKEVTIDCYHIMVANRYVVGMIEGGKFFIQRVVIEE